MLPTSRSEDGRWTVVLLVVVSKAQQSLVSDSSVQSLLASLLLGSPAERDCHRVRGEVKMLSPEKSLFPL